MPKRNILVTGANGFIGRALINRLDRNQFNVFALDNENYQGSDDLPVTKFFLQDITSSFEQLDINFDCVFHLAALNVTHVGKAKYQDYYCANVQGTKNLIEAINTQNFVFMSTVKVYQKQSGMIDEEAPTAPANDYERSKLEAEEICRQNFNKQNLTILRSVNIVGPTQSEKAVIPVFFKKAINNKPLEIIYPDGTFLQMLDVEDILRAFEMLLKKNQGVGTINLCSEEVITLSKLAEEIVTISQSKSSIIHKSDEEVAGMKFVSNKAKAMLGWQPEISIENILKNYHKFMLASK